VDDTWIGGEQAGLRGSRQLKDRRAALVLVAVEKRGRASGRVRMSVIPDFKAATIRSFLTQNVASGSTVYTEGLKSFSGLLEAALNISFVTNLSGRNCEKAPSLPFHLPTGRSKPPTVADRNLPRSEQGPTPGLPR
jgi:hypothetical protein